MLKILVTSFLICQNTWEGTHDIKVNLSFILLVNRVCSANSNGECGVAFPAVFLPLWNHNLQGGIKVTPV